jgi:Domain of unknown function (DUF1902)
VSEILSQNVTHAETDVNKYETMISQAVTCLIRQFVLGRLPAGELKCYLLRALVLFVRLNGADMSKPVIFTISAAWDDEASVWTGHSDDIPAAADAPTLDELLAKISAMALDLLPDNHPGVDPASLYLQITALREVEPAAA